MGNWKVSSCLKEVYESEEKEKACRKLEAEGGGKGKRTSFQPSKIWEFENYIIERLRSLGIVQ